MTILKKVALWAWTFPLPLMGWVNTKGPKLLAMGRSAPLGTPGVPELCQWAYEYKWWGGSRRFSFAAWPYIYVAYPEYATRREELMHHEHRHIQQQVWVGGILFLLSYGLCFVALWPFKGFDWYRAYRAIPWEVDARAYASRKMEEMEKSE